MKTEQVTVQTKSGQQDSEGKDIYKKAAFNHTFPENYEEAVSMLISSGMSQESAEAAVFDEFIAGYRVTIQAPARKVLEGCETDDVAANSAAVQGFMDSWKYGDKSPRGRQAKVDHVAAILAGWDTMAPEEQQRILQALGQKAGLNVPTPEATLESEPGESEPQPNRRPARLGR